MALLFQSHENSIQKLNNIVIFYLIHLCPSVISNRWRYDTSQDLKYLAKNSNNLITALIPNKILLRLGLYILSIRYLEDGAFCFTKVIKHDNIGFDRKMVDNENGKEDGKEAVTNSEVEVRKKTA